MFDALKLVEERAYFLAVCLTIAILVIILLIYFYTQASSNYKSILPKYSALVSNNLELNTELASQLPALQNSLSSLTAKYDQIEYNLTTPYTKLLYSSYSVDIPGRNVSQPNTTTTYAGPIGTFNTTNSITYYTYNFSFYAQYPGYLLFNVTSSKVNTQTNPTWAVLVSNSKIAQNNTLKYYNFESGGYYENAFSPIITGRGTYKINFDQNAPVSIYAPTPPQAGETVKIPVNSGTVYVWIANFNNQSITATFSAKYVGFHAN
jgi:hypothetical protein